LKSSAITRGLTRKQILVPHLESAISEGEFEWSFTFKPKERDDAWHPSSDCIPSLYDLFLHAVNPQESDFLPGMYKTFMVGHFWHGYIQNILLENLEFCAPEHVERRGTQLLEATTGEPRPFHWVTGSADVAPLRIPKQEDMVLDIKTMNSHDFRGKLAPSWTVGKWECQLNIYMDFFDLERGMILGVQKDSPHEFREFHFDRNQPLIDALYNKWRLVAMCLDENVSPPEGEDIGLPLKGPK
jgi:hypothetical protein